MPDFVNRFARKIGKNSIFRNNNPFRDKIQGICRAKLHLDFLKQKGSWQIICAVDVSEIAGANFVFMQHVHDLSANKAVPYGREVQKHKNREITTVAFLQFFCLLKAQPQTDYLAIDDPHIIHGSHSVLLIFLHEPSACPANDTIR